MSPKLSKLLLNTEIMKLRKCRNNLLLNTEIMKLRKCRNTIKDKRKDRPKEDNEYDQIDFHTKDQITKILSNFLFKYN